MKTDQGTSSTLVELALRCEQATGADDRLNIAITRYLYGDNRDMLRSAERGSFNPTGEIHDAKHLLATRTLWAVGDMEEGPFARLCWPQPDGGYSGGYVEVVGAANPALALCAAALRARAHNQGGE